MPRPLKETVDFFSHDCEHGQTMFILESRYGNDGYAFWFKLLERLGRQKGHCLDLNDEVALEFLAAKTRLSPGLTLEILDLLARLDAIDKDLWQKSRIVWCQNFVDRISVVYKERQNDAPKKPQIIISPPINEVSPPINEVNPGLTHPETHKLNKTKLNNISSSADDGSNGKSEIPFDDFWSPWPKKVGKEEAKKAWKKLKSVDRLAAIAGIKKQSLPGGNLNRDKDKIKHPQGWLNNRLWEDEILTNGNQPLKPQSDLPPHIAAKIVRY